MQGRDTWVCFPFGQLLQDAFPASCVRLWFDGMICVAEDAAQRNSTVYWLAGVRQLSLVPVDLHPAGIGDNISTPTFCFYLCV